MQKRKNKISCLIATLCLLGAGIVFGGVTAHADSITLSVERFSIGGDFIVEPTEVEIQENEKYSSVIPRVIDATGKYKAVSKNSSMGYYMNGIDGAQCEVNVPACIKKILDGSGEKIGENRHTDVKGLYEFDYTKGSGWMYTVNDKYVDAMSSVTARDGDVVRLMYTLTLGSDIFGKETSYGGKVYYNVADKTELLRLMAEANAAPEWWQKAGEDFTSAYQNAKQVMAQMDADENSVESAIALLQEVKESLPAVAATGVTMKNDAVTLVEGDSKSLKYELLPKYATTKSVTWHSDNPQIVSVDSNGTVKAVKSGVAKIVLTIDGSYTAIAKVTVKKAATALTLNPTSLTLNVGKTSKALSVTLYPQDSYAKIIWRSNNTDVASVTQDGVIVANDAGEAQITAMSETDSSIRAVCRVTVTAPVVEKTAQTIRTAVKAKTYSRGTIKKKAVNFKLGAQADGKLTYSVARTPSGGRKYIGVDKNGTVTLKKNAPVGTYEIQVSAAATANKKAASCRIKVNVTKEKQKIRVAKKTVTFKKNAVKKKKQIFSIGAKAETKLTYRLTKAPAKGKKYISISSKGKVTLKKGAPKGKYTITVKAAENKDYTSASGSVTVKVK